MQEKQTLKSTAAKPYSHVVVVGVDGAGGWFKEADTPHFDRIFQDGAVTYRALASNPTISAECWGSMLLGVGPEIHRLTNEIVSSQPYPADSPFPSLFRRIREAMPDAALGSYCDWDPITAGIVEQNLGVSHDSAPDTKLTPVICDYVRREKPTFLFIQFDSVDGAGHGKGYGTPGYLKRIHEVDALIGDVHRAYCDAGIIGDTLFTVIADHGGHGTGHGGWTDEEKYVTFAAAGKTVCRGELQEMNIRDLAAIVLYALGLDRPALDERGWTAQVPPGLFDDSAIEPYRDLLHLTGAAPRVSRTPHTSELTEKERKPMQPLKFYLVTDTHYFKNSLGAYGEAYEEFMDGEQKCFGETQSINEAAFAFLAQDAQADIILIAGDLSFNGEKESHKEFSKLLHEVQEKSGKRIYVVTAGHDFNEHPFAYNETGRIEPEGTAFTELYDFYKDFGYESAIAFNEAHLSYVAQLSEGVRLLVICNDVDGKKHITYDDDFLGWIETQARQAQQDGQMMIAMEHYPVLPGQPMLGLIGDAWQAESKKLVETLADNGVHLIFTGHMHNQSINEAVTEKGNRFYDVCTGSAIGWPAFIRLVTVRDEKTVEIESIPVPDFDWDKQGLSSKDYLIRQFERMIRRYLDAMANDTPRFMRKVHIKQSPALVKILGLVGKKLNKMTVGQFARLLLVKADPRIKDTSFVDFAVDIVRTIFEGNQPFVEGTPGGDTLLKVFRRMRPFVRHFKDSQGNALDFYETMKHTVGNYGIDDYNAVLKLR